MASPLIGIAGVNSLLFAAYGVSKRFISPFPDLSLQQIAVAGAMAGAANAILASPGLFDLVAFVTCTPNTKQLRCSRSGCKDNTEAKTISDCVL